MNAGSVPPNVAAVVAMLEAFDRRDAQALVALLDENVVARPPGFLLGRREEHGRDQILAGFADLEQVIGRDRTLEYRNRRFYFDGADENRVVVASDIRISVRGGLPFGAESNLLVTFSGGKATLIESWPTVEEALAQLGEPIEVAVEPGGAGS